MFHSIQPRTVTLQQLYFISLSTYITTSTPSPVALVSMGRPGPSRLPRATVNDAQGTDQAEQTYQTASAAVEQIWEVTRETTTLDNQNMLQQLTRSITQLQENLVTRFKQQEERIVMMEKNLMIKPLTIGDHRCWKRQLERGSS